MLCWLRWRARRRRNSNRRSTASLQQGCCSGKGAAARDLSVQTRARSGCGLRHLAARAATCAARSHRRNPRKPIRRDCREPAGVLARHCTEAGLIEKAASLWGKAGQRSLERSALVEAVAQLTRALDQIATLPATPALRREQIKLQVALITPSCMSKGMVRQKPKRRWSGHACSSSKRKR